MTALHLSKNTIMKEFKLSLRKQIEQAKSGFPDKARHYHEQALAMDDAELYYSWQQYVMIVTHLSHSSRDFVAIRVFGDCLIARGYKTSEELQSFWNIEQELEDANPMP